MRNSLIERGITFKDQDLQSLFDSLKFPDNKSDVVSNLEVYANAHLFKLDKAERRKNQEILSKIAIGCGVGVSERDLEIFENFSEQAMTITKHASEKNCMLYIDAEQTFMQAAIESFGQQLTHKFNVGDQAIIMNGFQCYLKRME